MADPELPKLTISLMLELHALPGDYRSAYKGTCDDEGIAIADIAPAISAGFVETDRDFMGNRRRGTKQ